MPIQNLTIYQDDDVTPWLIGGLTPAVTFSTDPAHARPHLKWTDDGPELSVNFRDGQANITSMSVDVVDVPTSAADQDTGLFTALLADASGDTQVVGHRFRLVQVEDDLSLSPVFDGVCSKVSQHDTLTGYRIQLDDMRARELKTRIFTKARNMAVLPRGPIDGYMTTRAFSPAHIPVTNQLIPPATGLLGTFRRPLSGTQPRAGIVVLDDPAPQYVPAIQRPDKRVEWWGDWSARNAEFWRAYGEPVRQWSATTDGFGPERFSNAILQWRPEAGGAWTTLTNMPVIKYQGTTRYFGTLPGGYGGFIPQSSNVFGLSRVSGESELPVNWSTYVGLLTHVLLNVDTAGVDQPADAQRVQVRILSNMEPTDAAPILLEKNAGLLLEELKDGLWSDFDPLLRFNQAAIDDMKVRTPTLRMRITRPVENMREWVEDNIYKPLGYAPLINEDGEITPVRYELPEAGVDVLQLDNTNISLDRKTAWSHGKENAVTQVTFQYVREILLANPNLNEPLDAVELVAERTVAVEWLSPGAASMMGDKPVLYEPETVRAFTLDPDGAPLGGDGANEEGTKLAQQRIQDLRTRFVRGAQTFDLAAVIEATLAGTPQVRTAKLGDWAIIAATWFPEYATAERGANRLAQIISARRRGQRIREFQLVDAGPAQAPIAQPLIGNLSMGLGAGDYIQTAWAELSVLPIGGAVLYNYALSDVQPPTTSGEWHYMGRSTVGAERVYTPPVGDAARVWIRARGTAYGRRASAWLTIGSVDLAVTPRFSQFRLAFYKDDSGNPLVDWIANPSTAGVRIQWAVAHPDEAVVAFTDTVDVAAGDYSAVLAVVVPTGMQVTVQGEPWTGFGAGAVSGVAGPKSDIRTLTRYGAVPRPPALSYQLNTDGELRVTAAGDPNTVTLHIAYSPTGFPSPEAAAAVAGIAGPVATTGVLATLESGARFYITAVAKGGSTGDVSDPAYLTDNRLGGQLPTVEIGVRIPESARIGYPIDLRGSTETVDIYKREHASGSAPATATDISGLGLAPVATLELRNGPNQLVWIPLTVNNNWHEVTAVPRDQLRKVGPVKSVLTAGPGAGVGGGASIITAIQQTSAAADGRSMVVGVQYPPDGGLVGAGASKLYRDGIYVASGSRYGIDNFGGGYWNDITDDDPALEPGTTYSYQVRDSGVFGVESAPYPATPVLYTTAAATLVAPVMDDIPAAVGGLTHLSWTPDAGDPPGTIYALYSAAASGDFAPGGVDPILEDSTTGTYMDTVVTSGRYYAVLATRAPWADSAFSNIEQAP